MEGTVGARSADWLPPPLVYSPRRFHVSKRPKPIWTSCQRCGTWAPMEMLVHAHLSSPEGAYECCLVVCAACSEYAVEAVRQAVPSAALEVYEWTR